MKFIQVDEGHAQTTSINIQYIVSITFGGPNYSNVKTIDGSLHIVKEDSMVLLGRIQML